MTANPSTEIAVFGSSEPQSGDPLYEQALETGRRLATAGFVVTTGGYGGVMEAASRGAREAGGRTTAVLCDIFSVRSRNAFIDEWVTTADLHERTRELINRASGFVVLGGKAGTLAELSQLWALDRAGCLKDRPVVLLGAVFRTLMDALKGNGMLDEAQLQLTRIVDTPAEAVEEIRRRLSAPAEGQR
jgi:uncharacterized protein (TIGR00730 family)